MLHVNQGGSFFHALPKFQTAGSTLDLSTEPT
jgi:hypothetical protein